MSLAFPARALARLPVRTRGVVQTVCFGVGAGLVAVAFPLAIPVIVRDVSPDGLQE